MVVQHGTQRRHALVERLGVLTRAQEDARECLARGSEVACESGVGIDALEDDVCIRVRVIAGKGR